MLGNAPGYSFSVSCDAEFERDEKGPHGMTKGEFRGWTRAAVKSVQKDHNSIFFWEIEPGPDESVIEMDEFYVRGRFRIVRKLTERKAARTAFLEFET